MCENNNLIAVCSVTEMARKIGLSRARFYQLQKMGVFPKPVYCSHSNRPFYTSYLQEKCLTIRKTGIGFNGQPIVFNCLRKRCAPSSDCSQEERYNEIADALKQMGLNVGPKKVKKAIEAIYPDKLAGKVVDGPIIRDLFRHFGRKVE